jgi:hypothetical protein
MPPFASSTGVMDHSVTTHQKSRHQLANSTNVERNHCTHNPPGHGRSTSEYNSVERGQRRRSRPALADGVGQNKVEIWVPLAADHTISILTTFGFRPHLRSPPAHLLHSFMRASRVLQWSWKSSECHWECAAPVRMCKIATRRAR